MSFDEWFDKNGELYRKPTSDERYLFEAGAQSRQAEIDELQKRIDDIKSKVQDLWTALDNRQSKEFIIDSCELIIGEILKGENHE